MKRTLLSFGILASFFATLLLPLSATAATTNLAVSPANSQGWVFNPSLPHATDYNFTDDESSTGAGSLYVQPIGDTANHKFIAGKALNQPLSSFQSFSYDFLIAGNGNSTSANQFYVNVYATYDNSGDFYHCRFDYNASQGSTEAFVTAGFDKTTVANAVGQAPNKLACPTNLNGMSDGSYIRAISVNVGDTSSNDSGLAAYLDNVLISSGQDTIKYDFETVTLPNSKEDCKKDGYKLLTNGDGIIFKNQGACVSYMAKPRTTTTRLNSNDSNGTEIPTTEGFRYKVTVNGTWTNRSGEVVDAECTSWQNGPWLNEVNSDGGPDYSADLLDVQINEEFVNWGDCDADNHSYTRWVVGTGDPINLRVFDGNTGDNEQIESWFGDNNGSLDVKVVAYPKN